MKKILKIITLLAAVLILGLVAIGWYVKKVLPDTGKPTNLKITAAPGMIERGIYLANHVAVCMDCHSQRDYSLFAGPIKEGTFGAGGEQFGKQMGFPGTIYSRNITSYSLNKWTDSEIFRAITTGVNKNGKALFSINALSCLWQNG